jgi:hypothetical protein
MTENADLPVFLEHRYEPDDEYVPGCLTIRCRFEDHGWSGRIIERGFVFQYFPEERQLFFYVFPTYVQLPLGKPSCLEEAIEQAKSFLRRWLGKDWKFQLKIDEEIQRLEEEQEAAKRSGKASSQSQGD